MGENEREERSFAEKLKFALNKGDVTTFKRLVKGGVDVNAKFWYKSTLLHEAVAIGNTEIVTLLLQNRAEVNAANDDGRTPLHIASRAGREVIVDALLQSGARVNACTVDGQTSLHVAVWQGRENVVRYLVAAAADVNVQDGDGWTALYWAAKLNYLEITKTLVEAGAKLNFTVKNRGRSALLEAVDKGHLVLAEYLVRQGADVQIIAQGETVGSLLMKNVHIPPDVIMRTADFFINAGYVIGKDQCMSIVRKQKRLIENSDFLQWIDNRQKEVLPLANLCRICIRKYLIDCSDGRRISPLIRNLPVPKLLLDFLEFGRQSPSESESVT
ncbi:hypothetical protein ACJMK2_013623 [Sinanodonta woodiana]|uniref:SOCS box domain-containing protein n=1 Tax=Sinanodonta woodiana TaxID=1069815 RepID=A0ABD3V1B9_SINWO